MKSNELNDLFDYSYKIFQNDDYFKFSIDSILLAEFVCKRKNDRRILDLCTGNAPVPLILSEKYGNEVSITGIELQKEIYQMGIDSINQNNVHNIELLNKNILEFVRQEKYDIITCNPPYFKEYNESKVNQNHVKAIARHEIKITLEGIFQVASRCIQNRGYFYLVHRPERLVEILDLCKKHHFGVKKIQFVYPNRKTACKLVLFEFCYHGEDYCKVLEPMYIDEVDSYKNIFRR